MTKTYTNSQMLTKGKFKLGLECPTKIYYYNNKKDYGDASIDDDFLQSLAKGGFQVGELATAYYPQGHKIDTLNKDVAVAQTNELLKQENVVIFEAALQYDNLLCRVDILVKEGNLIKLIEVKAKSCIPSWFEDVSEPNTLMDYMQNPKSYEGVLNKKLLFGKAGCVFKLTEEWKEYVFDIAFQTFVGQKALEGYEIQSFLCMPDKTKACEIDGLNQKFMVYEENGRNGIKTIGDVSPEALGESILATNDVSWLVKLILDNTEATLVGRTFQSLVSEFATICKENIRQSGCVSSICKKCSYNYDEQGKKNGYIQCMVEYTGLTEKEIRNNESVMKIWFHNSNGNLAKDENGKCTFLMKDLTDKDFPAPIALSSPLSRYDRQFLQVEKVRTNDNSEYLDKEGLKKELLEVKFPIHFIDFETSMVALPFNKGDTPYQLIAFQFSHHTLSKNGRVKHEGQYINLEHGTPNYDFVRELKKQLENDDGSIFRWSNHENTVLVSIKNVLMSMDLEECPDRDSLVAFLETITTEKGSEGERTMLDMWDLYKKFHYMPETHGSNSIKYVLPAVLGRFTSLHSVLSNPVYGKGLEYTSQNFEEKVWIEFDKEGNVKDPYSLLPKIFDEYDMDKLDLLFDADDLKNGGTAMMAYAVTQFKMMSIGEKEKIKEALLRYCELDTFAMVMIYLYWYESLELGYDG